VFIAIGSARGRVDDARKDGWWATGDVMRQDEAGDFLVRRQKEKPDHSRRVEHLADRSRACPYCPSRRERGSDYRRARMPSSVSA